MDHWGRLEFEACSKGFYKRTLVGGADPEGSGKFIRCADEHGNRDTCFRLRVASPSPGLATVWARASASSMEGVSARDPSTSPDSRRRPGVLGGGAAPDPAAFCHPQGLQVLPGPEKHSGRLRAQLWLGRGPTAGVKMPFSSWKRLVLGCFLLQMIKDLAKKKKKLTRAVSSFILSCQKNLGAMKVPESSSHLFDPLHIAGPWACSLMVTMWWL